MCVGIYGCAHNDFWLYSWLLVTYVGMVEAFTWFIFEIISIMTYKNGVISQKMLNKNDECFYCFNFYSGHTQNFILFNLLKKSRKSVDAY